MSRGFLRLHAAVTVALLASACFTGQAAAAKLPEWTRPITEGAEPAPEGVPEHPSQVLFSEMRYAVEPDGSVRIRRRFAAQALSADADKVGIGWFYFEETARVTASRAWHVPPGDRAKKSWLPPADVSVGNSFLGDSKLRVVTVPGVRKGSLVFFEFEAIDKPYFLSLGHLFYEGAPVKVARIEVETPPGWSVRWAWPRGPGPDPAVSGETRTWELHDIAQTDEEPLGPPPRQQAPMLVVSAAPAPGASCPIPTFSTWGDFSSWYERLVKGRHDPTPAVKAAAGKALAETGTDILGKIRAAGKFVRDNVRYVAVELGIGGYQPRPAAETLATLYGDCKDKATLLRSLLAEAGIESYPVLVNLTDDGTVSDDLPSNGFNHLVVAVPLPSGTEIPADVAPAILEVVDLGRLLIVDTTDERTWIGSLSAGLAGKRALVVAGPLGQLVTLPGAGPAAHRIERRISASMGPDRSLSIERRSKYVGQFAAGARGHYSSSVVDRREGVERKILHIWPDAEVKGYSAEYETAEGAFIETVMALHRPLPAGGPESKVSLFPGAGDDVDRVALGKRKTAVEYLHPLTIRYEVKYEGVPDAAPLPAPQDAKGEGWSVKMGASREAGAVIATWEVVLRGTRFEPEAFPELRRFWSAVTSSAIWTLDMSQ